MKFTKAAIEGLELAAGKSEMVFWDSATPGFGCRIRPTSRTWRIQYRTAQGRQRSEALGDIRKVSLEDACRIARQRFAAIELGRDPGAERAAARRASVAAELTFAVAAARYMEVKRRTLRASTCSQAQRFFVMHWKPLHDLPLDSIKRSQIAAHLHELVKEHGRMAAARARANLSALFNWAMKEGLVDGNPVTATNDPQAGIRPRERTLSDEELATVWRCCLDDNAGAIIKLLILTGARRDEIGRLKWSEINLGTGQLSVPGERTKNHRALELTLPPVALRILQKIKMEGRGGEFVFGRGDGGFAAWSWATLSLRARITHALGRAPERFTLHDLRRTMRTGLGRLGIPPHIAELAINHARAGIQAIYDKHSYQPQIAAALAAWADHVQAIVEGRAAANVVPMMQTK
jgi:integrase